MLALPATDKRKLLANCRKECRRAFITGEVHSWVLPWCNGKAEGKRGATGKKRQAGEPAGFYTPPDMEAGVGPAPVLVR